MLSKSSKKSSLIEAAPLSRRNIIAQLLVACVLLQTAAPAAFASQPRPGAAGASAGRLAGAGLRGLTLGAGNFAAGVFAFVRAALARQEDWNVVLTPLTTDFHGHTGLDYHQPSKKLVVSANAPSGDPHSFELIASDGAHSPFSNIAGLGGDVIVAAARDDGAGASLGGFHPGELFTSAGSPGAVARVSADGATVQNPWVVLPDEAGLISGLHLDRTGAFGGDLLAVTTTGGVWRVNSSATPTRLAALNTPLAGVAVVPGDPERYGPWAGKALVGAGEQGSVYAVDAEGQADPLEVGLNPQDIDVVPAHENFFALDPAGLKLLGAPEGAFAGVVGDILVTQGSPGRISRLRWDGAQFAVSALAEAGALKQVAFSPAGVGQLPPVKQVYDKIAVVRHAPRLDSGRVEGTLWQLTGENVLLDGTDTITTDLLVPGTPTVTAARPDSYGGTVVGSEGAQPSGYAVTIKGNAHLRHVVTRTDPIELEDVAFPPAPAGARDAELRRAGQTIGDPATLRHLSISGHAGAVVVPPGTYGKFTVGGRNALVLGVEGSTEPSVYNLEGLALTGGSELRLVGRVTLRVRDSVTLAGSTVGAADDPKRLLIEVADGLQGDAVKVSGNGVLYGVVRAPQGDVSIEGNGRLRGTVSCDYLFVDGNGVLQITENDIPPPPVNRPPSADAGPEHTITLPTDTAALEGTASDDGLPAGSTLSVTWTKVSGPGSVTFADAHSAATSATFGGEGVYVLKLTASDGQLSASDTTTVTVIPRNQPPTVDAGQDQTIELPAPAELRGTVADDALPRGSTVTATWSMVSGPGAVTFADPHAAATAATFILPGTYTLRLSASDTEFTVSDDVVVTVLKNEPPVVNAGPDGEITLPQTAALNGAASDDGLPRGSTLEVSWSQTSGPAPAVFHDAFAPATAVTFTAPGTYVLRLTASDSQLSASDEATVVVRPQPFTARTYTLDADFEEGSLISVTHGVTNQLQLDDTTQTFNFIWVAVSSKGTVVKINTETGAVIGEYLTSPAGQPKDPSRTTVDQNGNVWATNRDGNSVLHIGLVENGQCIDRNQNGVIDTSAGFGDIKPWPNTGGANTNGGVTLAQDECIIHYTKVNSFGTRHVSVTKDNDIWVSGTNGRRFDLIDGRTGAIKRAETSVGFGGYGGLIDKFGVIWSARSMLRWDTSKPLTGANGTNWRGYNHDSYGLCIDSQGNVWNTSLGPGTIRKFAPDGTQIGIFNQGDSQAQGCVVDRNDHVWVAHSLFRRTVGHLKNDGSYVGTVTVGDGPTGVAVDGAGKVWATNHNSRTVSRINPALGPLGPDGVTRVGAVEFTTRDLGGSLYNYSDMTGSTLSGAPGTGTWTTVFDSQKAGSAWGRIGWTGRVCGDGLLAVSVASSENGTTFGPPETVTNGADPSVANGRYLKVSVSFRRASSGESPILYDLSVGTSGYELPAAPNTTPSVFAGTDQTMTLPDAARLNGTACDDGFPRGNPLAITWSKVSGPGTALFTRLNSTASDVTFTLPGEYVLRLTAGDGEFTVSDEVTVTALPANMTPIVNAGPNQTITLPNTANLSGTVSDDGLPAGGALTVFWSQLGGPGVASFDDPSSPATRAVFPVAGTYTLRLAGNDTHRVGSDDVVITVNAAPALNGATLALAAGNVGPYVTGTTQPLRATLRNSAGNPLANYGVEFEVTGPNATAGSAVTNASGVATFNYSGTNAGTDTVRALVRNTATASINSPAVAMTWTLTQTSPPSVQGWIGGPLNGSTATGTVPITVGAGQTLTQATVEYWPASNPAAVTVLATGAQGGPGATLAALDTTLLANGNYVIQLRATDAAGQELVSQVIITVAGENKPGRITLTVTDLTVPIEGLPITIGRTYDSLERNQVGDFGHGWSLNVGSPRLEVSPDNDVTITEPGTGRRVTFNFSPTSFGFPFSFFFQPAYTAEPGVFGKLTADGCGMLIRSGAQFGCFLSADPYRPTVYAYTDPYGRVYTMSAGGALRSVKTLSGETLTFTPSGITSSEGGLSVPFTRDAQGRIGEVTDPTGKVFSYNYDAAGDLAAVNLPGVTAPVTYTYDSGHLLLKSTDARGNPEATNTYTADGRLASITNAVGETTRYAYDTAANTTTQTNPDGGVVTHRYDGAGLLLSETNALGHTTTHTYDARRNKLTETNALGQVTRYTYDASGNKTSITDPLGRTTRATYNQFGLPLNETDQLGNVRTVVYDAALNPTAVRDQLGTLTTFTVDSRGNPLTVADGAGSTTRFTYDAYGHQLTITDALGRTTTNTYDGMGRVETTTDPHGGVTRYTYDALGRVLSVTQPATPSTVAFVESVAGGAALGAQVSAAATNTFEYDANGNRTAYVDALGRRTTYEYDAANRMTKVNYADGTSVSSTYDFRGQKLTQTDQLGRTTSYAYDLAGQLLKVRYPDGSEVRAERDALERVVSVADERGNTTRYDYDASCGCSDRVAKITNALGQVTQYKFDATGKLVGFVDAAGRERLYSYDVRNRMTHVTYPDGTTVKQVYDNAGRVVSSEDQGGKVTKYGYDAVGNLASVTDALNQTTIYTHDATRNILSQTDANGRTTTFEYDALSQMTKRTQPLGMTETFSYDAIGNLIARVDQRGRRTAYAYDQLDRLLRKTPDASLGEPPVSYTYTPTGERATMTDASGTTTYAYDIQDRLESKQTPQGTLTYTYDAADNLLTMNSPGAGLSVSYTYDALNRLATVTDGRLAQGTTAYTYDAVGNLTGDARPNGVRSAYTYNSVNRLTNLALNGAGSLASYAYTLGPTGRRLSAAEQSGRNTSYSYDSLYRLTGETVGGGANPAGNGAVSYGYDPVGNRLSRTSTMPALPAQSSTYDANDRLTSNSHDANGNARVSDGRNFTYDFENRLKAADGGAVRVVYDGDGNLAAKTVGGVTTRYLVDDLNPTGYSQVVGEVVGGQVERTYTYGHMLVNQNRVAGGGLESSFYGYDGHGNVRLLTDAAGSVTDTYDYDAFGTLTSSTGATPNAYLYSGERYDADLGLYHLRARHYDQRRGRFTSTDPFAGYTGAPHTLHKYTYVHADPVNFIDPSGLSTSSEYRILSLQAFRAAPAMRRLSDAIICIFVHVASVIAQDPNLPLPPSLARFAICRCKVVPVGIIVDLVEAASGGGGMSPTNYPNPDPPMSEPPVRHTPRNPDEVRRMRDGKGPVPGSGSIDDRIAPHHRQQVPIENGGVMDEITERQHTRDGNHTRHNRPSSFTPGQRAREIRRHWRRRGWQYALPGECI